MKKMSVLITSLCALGAAVAMAAEPVSSVNIVGYQTINFETGKWALVSTAFQSVDGIPLQAANVFSNQVPKGTRVLVYDSSIGAYISDSKAGVGEGKWSTNITFQGGMGLWVYMGSVSNGPSSYDVTLAGQVPLEGAMTNSIYNSFNLLGYPYTAPVHFTNTALYKTSFKGDSLILFQNNNYISYSKGGVGAGIWGPSNYVNVVFTPQTGFWYKSASNLHFNVETRPYNP